MPYLAEIVEESASENSVTDNHVDSRRPFVLPVGTDTEGGGFGIPDLWRSNVAAAFSLKQLVGTFPKGQ